MSSYADVPLSSQDPTGVQTAVVNNPGTGPATPPPAASLVSGNPSLQLQRNPQLPQHPLGAYTDAQYEAAYAALRADTARKYADVLQQLGYVDPQTGQFIQGSVEAEANRQRGLLNRSMRLAGEDVTKQHQQLGTLFSGLRGTDQARAEFPFTDALGQLDVNTPLSLAQLYEKGSGLMNDFTIQNNQLLADAAARQAHNLTTAGTGGGATTTPNTPPTTPAGAAPIMGLDPGAVAQGGVDPNTPVGGFVDNILGNATPPSAVPYNPATGAGLNFFGGPSAPVPNLVGGGPSNDTMAMAPTPTPAPIIQPAPILSAAQKKLLQYG